MNISNDSYTAVLINTKVYTWPEVKEMNDEELKERSELILDTGYPDNIRIESLRNKKIV